MTEMPSRGKTGEKPARMARGGAKIGPFVLDGTGTG